MSNIELYKNAYVESFEIEIDIVENLEYQSIRMGFCRTYAFNVHFGRKI